MQLFKEVEQMGLPVLVSTRYCKDRHKRFSPRPCVNCEGEIGCRAIIHLKNMCENIMGMEGRGRISSLAADELILLAIKRTHLLALKEKMDKDFFVVCFDNGDIEGYDVDNLMDIVDDERLAVDVHLVKKETK